MCIRDSTGRPSTSIEQVTNSGYADVENSPLYPFGFGLSYTNFSYSNFSIDSDKLGFDSKINVSVEIENTGFYKGKEVVQLYIRDIVGSIARPMKELKGFETVELAPGESQNISFQIDSSLLEFYTHNNKWEAEVGKFHVFIVGDSNVSEYKEFYLTD